MPYISTRAEVTVSAAQAILRGISQEGGLFVPTSLPSLSMADFEQLAKIPYAARAALVLSWLLDDYSLDELTVMAEKAYARFDHADVAPLLALDEQTFVLELFHGPTLAFKDMALQFLPHLLTAAAQKCGETREIAILTATSGDTGKAAQEGFADVPGTSVTVFYPLGGVSKMQELQMCTAQGSNVHAISVLGNFDDAQTGVKKLFTSPEFIAKMAAQQRVLSSANSINLGRLVPQVAYYLSSCAELMAKGIISADRPLHICVPTGNFGNILAAWYAKRMGAPIGKLICASNANDVLTDFIRTGVYDARRDFHKTLSPSMDILISSNLERLLYELAGCDSGIVRGWMDALKKDGVFRLTGDQLSFLQQHFAGYCADDNATCEEIKQMFDGQGYLYDPHTAVASAALRQYRAESDDAAPTLIVATASPFKFAADVAGALELPRTDDAFASARALSQKTGLPLPHQLMSLETLPILHSASCVVDGMEAALLSELNK